MKYLGYDLKSEIVDALVDLRFKEFTPIQKEVLPLALNNKCFIGQSKTGSGKTHAFLVPIFNKLDLSKKEVQVIICTPTRELATQIYNVAIHIASFFKENIDIKMYSGGTDRNKEISRLNETQPQIVIGTPGKISDLMVKANVLKGYTANTLVIDEADMAFEIGFMDDLDLIAGRLTNPQIMVFSATIREEIKPFIAKYIKADEHIKVDMELCKIEHVLIPIKGRNKMMLLNWVLKNINPYLALIFGNKKGNVDEIASYLTENGYRVAVIHGGLTARERKRIMKEINDLKYQYIIATDIAARGIDIDGVSHVINFDLPNDFEFYIHRSGRTARANLDGICYSFCDFKNEEYLRSLEMRGISFIYQDIRENGFIEYKANRRIDRKKPISEAELKAKRMVSKPKKVTPNYKKKQNERIKKIAKKMRNERWL